MYLTMVNLLPFASKITKPVTSKRLRCLQKRDERLTHIGELIGQTKQSASSSDDRLSAMESPPAFELEEEYSVCSWLSVNTVIWRL